MAFKDGLKSWARLVKRDVHAIYLAAKDPRTPWYAKALALFVAGYALSPIDLIPDFIPILGYTDDAILRHGALEAEVAFLHKPFTPEMLAREIRAAVE